MRKAANSLVEEARENHSKILSARLLLLLFPKHHLWTWMNKWVMKGWLFLSIDNHAYCLGSTKMNKSWFLCLKGNAKGKKKMSTNKCNPTVFYSPRKVARFQVLSKSVFLWSFFFPCHPAHQLLPSTDHMGS